MSKSKLFKALNTLVDDEWHSFRKFILIYVQKNSEHYKLLTLLYKRRKDLQSTDLKNNLFTDYFKNISRKTYLNYMSTLFGHLEKWFIWQESIKDKHQANIQLIKAYNDRGLFDFSESIDKKIREEVNKESYLDLNHSTIKHQLNHQQYFSNNPTKNKSENYSLEKLIEALNEYYLEQSLLYLCEFENYREIYNLPRVVDFNDTLKGLSTAVKSPLSEFLAKLYTLLKSKDYDKLKELIYLLEEISFNKNSDTYLIITSYLRRLSVVLWMENKMKNPDVLIHIYEKFLDAIVSNSKVRLTDFTFTNAIDTLATLGSFEKTNKFIEQWYPVVDCSYPEGLLAYSKAINCFKNERYSEISMHILSASISNPILKIVSNALILISYYMENNTLVYNQIRNFKLQLKRNKKILPKNVYLSLLNLTKVINMMNKAKYDKSIIINLEDFSPIFYKSWLIKTIKK